MISEQFIDDLREEIKRFKFLNDISLDKMSRDTGVSGSTLCNFLAERNKPSSATIRALLEYLKRFV